MRKTEKGASFLVQIPLLVALIICLISACDNSSQAKGDQQASSVRAVRIVEVDVPKEGEHGLEVSGVIKSTGQVELAFQLGGLVESVLVKEGDQVKEDQVLARLDAELLLAQRDQAQGAFMQAQAVLDLYQEGTRKQEIEVALSQVRSTQASSNQAEADYKRSVTLYEQGVIPKQKLDTAESGYKQAAERLETASKQLDIAREGPRAQELDSAKGAVIQASGALSASNKQLQYAALTAPISGTIVWRNLEPGMSVSSGKAVLELADLENLEIETQIPESDFSKLHIGDTAKIRFPSFDVDELNAVVKSIAPQAQDDTRGFPVRLVLPDCPDFVVPGLVALVEFPYQAIPKGIRIPTRSIVDSSVFTVVNSKAQLIPVTVLKQMGEYTYVEGLNSTDQVVINGQHYLSDGETVNIVNALAIDEITTLEAK